VEAELEIPHHLDRIVHDRYFNPQYPEFQSCTMWSQSNALTSAFKELEPVPAFKRIAKLADFLKGVFLKGLQYRIRIVESPSCNRRGSLFL